MLSLRIRHAPSLAIAAALLAASVFPLRPARAQVQTNPTPSNQPATRLKVTSNLVVVRVVVRDAQGKPVNGLRKEDFRLFDSGKERPIAQFEAESAVEPPSPPVVIHRTEQATATLSPALPGRFLALYFDDLNTSDNDMVQVRRAADDYLAANLQPTDRVAIFTSGAMLSDFTSDPKQIHEALSRLRVSPRAPVPGHDCPDLSDYQALEMMQTSGKLDLNNPWNTGDAWGLALEEATVRDCLPTVDRDYRAMTPQAKINTKTYLLGKAAAVLGQAEILASSNLRELEQVVKYTAQMPGQRTVILGSPGFLLLDNNQFQVERLIDQALRLEVVISSLDPRGLATIARQVDASRIYNGGGATGTSSGALHRLDQNREVLAGDVLAQVADGTGGEFFHNNNDLKAGFGRLAGSPGSYILAFAPKDLKPDGKRHELKVKLVEKQPGYSIYARHSYFAPGKEAEAKEVETAKEVEAPAGGGQVQEQIREALLSKTETAQFPVALDAEVSAGQGETHELSLMSHVDPKSLHLQKQGDHNLNTLTFIFGVFDQKENLLTAQQRHATVDVSDGQLPEFLAAGMKIDMAFQLKPGSYRIREVVTDSEQRLTALSRNVEIPVIVPAMPAASASPPHPSQAPAQQSSAQPNLPLAQPSQPPIPQPVEQASSASLTSRTAPPAPSLQAPVQQAVTRSASDPATEELLRRVWGNYAAYLSSIPNVFADEHVVSSLTTAHSSIAKQGIHDSETDSTFDSTTDSIFRLKRVSTDGKTADLVESREVKYVNRQAATKDQSLTGPAILIGAFTRAPNVFSPELKSCYDYHLLPTMRRKPGDSFLFLHGDVLVLEYALKSPLPASAQCPESEQTTGRAFIDPSSMQIVRFEQQRPHHSEVQSARSPGPGPSTMRESRWTASISGCPRPSPRSHSPSIGAIGGASSQTTATTT